MRHKELPLNVEMAKMLEMTVCAGQECGMSAEECAVQAAGVIAKMPRTNAAILYGLIKLFGTKVLILQIHIARLTYSRLCRENRP